MKHLRRYNEAVGGLKEVEEFCANYLANLLDDESYDFSVTSDFLGNRVSPSYRFSLIRNYNGAQNIIKWDDIKDQIIPFLHMLTREYSIEPSNYQSKKNVYIDDNPRNRTIRFNRYLPDTYSSDFYYMDIRNVIKDEGVPKKFYQIQIQFS